MTGAHSPPLPSPCNIRFYTSFLHFPHHLQCTLIGQVMSWFLSSRLLSCTLLLSLHFGTTLHVGLCFLVFSLKSLLWRDEQQAPSVLLKAPLALSLGLRGTFWEWRARIRTLPLKPAVLLYSFSIVLIANHHTLSGLNQHRFMTLHFGRSLTWASVDWNKGVYRAVFLSGDSWRILALSRFQRLPTFIGSWFPFSILKDSKVASLRPLFCTHISSLWPQPEKVLL